VGARVKKIRLVCWKDEDRLGHAERLKKAGLVVDASAFDPAGMITRLREDPPAVMLIDLERLPSHGREVAVMLRTSKSMRHIPIVFAGGVREKIARVREEIPDGIFTDWAKAVQAVKSAMKNAPAVVAQPVPHMQRYTGSRLSKKLDLKAGMKAVLIGAEEGFLELLGDLPDVEFQARVTAETKLMLWFVRASQEVAHAFEIAGARMLPGCSLWIIYPKKAGRYKVDFNQNDIRVAGIAAGLVDYKICAVDADWSGMKFAKKKVGRR
jgi:DNA-binding NarL/FixJ family response regulator